MESRIAHCCRPLASPSGGGPIQICVFRLLKVTAPSVSYPPKRARVLAAGPLTPCPLVFSKNGNPEHLSAFMLACTGVARPQLFQVKLRPLPQTVARFLGLLENNRMALDHRGYYVRVSLTHNRRRLTDGSRSPDIATKTGFKKIGITGYRTRGGLLLFTVLALFQMIHRFWQPSPSLRKFNVYLQISASGDAGG